jgi:hypothetical protein
MARAPGDLKNREAVYKGHEVQMNLVFTEQKEDGIQAFLVIYQLSQEASQGIGTLLWAQIP